MTKSNEQMKKFRSPFNTEFASKSDNADRGSYEETNTKVLNYDGDFSVTYGKLINEKHMINAVGGMRLSQNGSDKAGIRCKVLSMMSFLIRPLLWVIKRTERQLIWIPRIVR